MNPLKTAMDYAASGMRSQSQRISVTAENMSNADTPGYRRKFLVSEPISAGSQFRSLTIELDPSPGARSFDPNHPMADADGYVDGSNVSPVIEMADLREASRTYEANVNAFQQARSMYRSLLDVLRR